MKNILLLLISSLLLPSRAAAAPLGSTVTYQGRLTDGAAAANGTYDLRFALFDSDSGSGQVGAAITNEDVLVSGGLFSVPLDFGPGAFTNQTRWLEIGVRPGTNTGAFTALSPRQPLLPTPYALYSPTAGTALTAATATTATTATTAGSVPWSAITGVPAGFADGVDNDTTYIAGAGLNLSGTTFAVANGGIGTAQLTDGAVTGAKLAAGSVGATQLSRRYLAGSLAYSLLPAVTSSFATRLVDQSIGFSTSFNNIPIITLTLDTPHAALPAKGSVLIVSKSTSGFTARIPWAPVGVQVAPAGSNGNRPRLAVVDGNPAVIGSGTIGFNIGLVYSHATDSTGQNWAAPVMIQTGYPSDSTLLVVNGNPAIAFVNGTGGISYTRASDADGISWPAPVQIYDSATSGAVARLDGVVAGGNPALLMASAGKALYLRASDASGSAWGTPSQLLSNANSLASIDLAVIGGKPAMAALVSQNIYFALANDSAGASWPAPIVAVPDPNPASPWGGPLGQVTLMETRTTPSLGFVATEAVAGSANTQLMFASANDPSGSSWGAAQSLTTPESGSVSAVFAMVGAGTPNPSAAIVRTASGLTYSPSFLSGSFYFFGTPGPVEAAGGTCDILDVGGQAAIAFYSSGSLRFIRDNTAPPNSALNWIAVEP